MYLLITSFCPKSNQKGGMQIKSHAPDTLVGLANVEWETAMMARLARFLQTWDIFSIGKGEESRNLTTTYVSLTV